jgi:hypothetical protein
VGIVSRLFGPGPDATKAGQARAGSSRAPHPDREATHRQLLVTAVKDTLRTHGIPATWLTVETLTAAISAKERGMHLRLILRDARLLPYAVDMQTSIHARISRLDPLSPAWMAGISWRLEVADGSSLQLPDAGYWQRVISNPTAPAPAAEEEAEASTPAMSRAMLDKLFGSGPAKADRPDFSPTQPMEAGR